ncbi:DNA cytosine methyltransferase [Flavobacterium sp. AG291]|uniref:DNA cytosine methyltransferase n=1 Tax=Flavobacterium sp. AG291 TaxID=2184000 RepID=UPI000E0ADFBE|nr:DNA cytosine methyltransferase [Flavobacterium sp. AG291]RDI05347.1 DNA (cytosine-5)-methyltransferase 1 [Flavobacterium sp. AG291]
MAKQSQENVKDLYGYSLFSGGGGFHIGMKKAGFKVLVANDIEPKAEETHKKNWPETPFLLKDIRLVTSEELLNLAGGIKPDIIFGGPPCQGFSTLGAKLSSDPRNILFDHFVRIVDELNPKYFLFENVKSLTTMYNGQFKENIIKKFEAIGYNVTYKIINAADYGVPQHRHRVFFCGTRLDPAFEFPEPTHGPKSKEKTPYKTVGEAIMDLANLKEQDIENHKSLEHSQIVVERYKLIKEGGKLPPKELLPKELQRTNFGNTYKRLDRNEPSLTMVPGNNAFPIHPVLNRSLTPREAARIQTFPDNHVFMGDRRRQCILVGNAVAPLLAEILGNQIIKHLYNSKEKVIKKGLNNKQTFEDSLLENTFALKKFNKLSSKDGFIDLFSGAGGFTIGFGKAGWKPLLSVDINKNVTATHEFNMPSFPYLEGNLGEDNFRNSIIENFKGKEIGIIVGGPPCQGFSIFGKRRFVNTKGYDPHIDPRNKLVYAYLDVIKELNPRWFLMENVPGLTNLDNGLFLENLITEFKSLGFNNTEFKVLNAADYGVPQLRKRLIIIGNRTGHIIPWPKKKYFEKPKDWQKPYRTVGEAISDLMSDNSYQKVPNHVPMNHKPLLIERYKYIEEGCRLDISKLPDELKSGYRTDEVKNFSHVFKRLHREKPANTMVPGHNAFPIHPVLNRALTVREAARIQTFPDEIIFQGNRQEQCIQVGNAFPPMLAEILANSIMKAEINNWYPNEVPASAWYSLLDKQGYEEQPIEETF